MVRTIGVLALQGGVAAHTRLLDSLSLASREVRRPEDLRGLGGLVLPGGESSTQLKLLIDAELYDPVLEAVTAGMPALGTCAGLILLATAVTAPSQRCFALLDMDCRRNGYGRQLHSQQVVSDAGRPLIFIRAPRITRLGGAVEILDSFAAEPVAVRQGSVYGATFHPELADDGWLHRLAFR